MKALRLGANMIRVLVKDTLYYPGRLIADSLTTLARCGVLLVLYAYVFQLKGGTIHGTTFVMTAWSMFFYFTFLMFHLTEIARTIMRDVQSGQIEILLSKPISYLGYRMWWQIGAGLYSFVMISLVGGGALALLVGFPPNISLGLFVPTLLLTLALGIVLTLFVYTCIGLLSFWIEDINPLLWIANKTLMILGGSYLPIALFPNLMYRFAVWSPLGALNFVTHTVYPTWTSEWIMKISIQLFWIVVAGLAMWALFLRAHKRVSVNGG